MARDLGVAEDELLDAMREALLPAPEIDLTAMTMSEMAAQYDIGRTTAQNRVRKAVEEGRLERVTVTRVNAIGVAIKVPAYRPVRDGDGS